jgi:hypothetical protein
VAATFGWGIAGAYATIGNRRVLRLGRSRHAAELDVPAMTICSVICMMSDLAYSERVGARDVRVQ